MLVIEAEDRSHMTPSLTSNHDLVLCLMMTLNYRFVFLCLWLYFGQNGHYKYSASYIKMLKDL